MKNKIRLRLLLYFSGSLLIFSIIMGLFFVTLFSRYNMEIHKDDLSKRAERIAASLSDFWAGAAEPGHGHGMMAKGAGYGTYLRFIDDIAMTDVWVVERSLGQILRGHGQASVAFKDLPPGAEDVITTVLNGKSTFSRSFGSFLGAPSITLATPIVFPTGEIAGVVLLHEQIENINGATRNGLLILLLSIGAAIVISFFIAGVLSEHFTKPLGKMTTAAQEISGGNYATKTGVTQNDEIGELAKALDDMATQLDTASKEGQKLENLRRDFVANISHELRTPVTVIRGSLEALNEGVVSEPKMVGNYLRQMLKESIYLERLVSDLLDLAKLQNPDFAIEMSRVNLKDVATDALRSMERLAAPKRIVLKMAVEGEDFTLNGDYGRLRQMLMIVLDNAIKFSPAESTVHVSMKHTGDDISLSIRDAGSGILPAELPHIFERFHKQRSEENKSGTGLGLAIAKQIADRHGIDIKVHSKPGEGAEFCFIF